MLPSASVESLGIREVSAGCWVVDTRPKVYDFFEASQLTSAYKDFKCPRCGGKYFGRIVNQWREPTIFVRCDCYENGESTSNIYFPEPDRRRGLKLCGWVGEWPKDAQ